MESQGYKVIPVIPPPPGLVVPKPVVKDNDIGCLIIALAYIALAVSLNLMLEDIASLKSVLIALTAWAAVLASFYLVVYRRRRKKAVEATLAQAHQTQLQQWELSKSRSEEEALSLSNKASEIRLAFGTTLRSMETFLESTNSTLDAAEHDYSERAFGPFWDHVEQAARYLAEFKVAATKLKAGATEYQLVLQSRDHNFPDLTADLYNILDPTPTIRRFRHVIRAAQRDIEFSTIWEHRRTRDVLIHGFGSLGEAVDGLSSTLVDSIGNLKSTIVETSGA